MSSADYSTWLVLIVNQEGETRLHDLLDDEQTARYLVSQPLPTEYRVLYRFTKDEIKSTLAPIQSVFGTAGVLVNLRAESAELTRWRTNFRQKFNRKRRKGA